MSLVNIDSPHCLFLGFGAIWPRINRCDLRGLLWKLYDDSDVAVFP